MYITQRCRGPRQGFAYHGQLVGRRSLPQRLVSKPFEMIEHVVEHAVTIPAKIAPIGGIERAGEAGLRHANGLLDRGNMAGRRLVFIRRLVNSRLIALRFPLTAQPAARQHRIECVFDFGDIPVLVREIRILFVVDQHGRIGLKHDDPAIAAIPQSMPP